MSKSNLKKKRRLPNTYVLGFGLIGRRLLHDKTIPSGNIAYIELYGRIVIRKLNQEQLSQGSEQAWATEQLRKILHNDQIYPELESATFEPLPERVNWEGAHPPRRSSRAISQTGDSWEVLNDDSGELQSRLDALEETLLENPAKLVPFIISELDCKDINPTWLAALVDTAELLQIDDMQQRAKMSQQLLAISRSVRASGGLEGEPLVWSAMRTIASLQGQDCLKEFVGFLAPGSVVDTKLVALQCIVRVLESNPMDNPCTCQELSDRVYTFATKYLDPDVFQDGQNAAIASAAIRALILLGDSRANDVLDVLTDVCKTSSKWFIEYLRNELQESLEVWMRCESAYRDREPYARINSHLKCLDSCA